jgi:hypothetical protein
MSYDLYFYKEKNSPLSNSDIRNYLTTNLAEPGENGTQWFFENDDTEVYFSFDENEPEDDPEMIESFDNFDFYKNTNFSFNINFLRPDFFGLEAFSFIENFISDLNLCVLNPQSSIDPDNPKKTNKDELYQNWSTTNLSQSASLFNECALNYYPLKKSNSIWEYNYNRKKTQNDLGDDYFVPKIFFFKTKKTNKIVSVTTWTENIPCVLPNADYYLIFRKYKSFFREIKDNGIISSDTLFHIFSNFVDDHEIEGCKIIHSHNTSKTFKLFNNLKLDFNIKEFMEKISIEKIVNVSP